MNELAVYALGYFVIFGAIGMLIGQRKGRTLAGLIWSMLLGPFGWLVVALGPNIAGGKSTACPLCGGVLPISQAKCNHCGNAVHWIKGRPYRPSRAV